MAVHPWHPWFGRSLVAANVIASAALIATGFRSGWMMSGATILHTCLFYAIVGPLCPWLAPVVTRFRPRGREVWLTIDDGPAGRETEELSEEMQRRGVRATFFIEGRRLLAQPDIAAKLEQAGHNLANHTQTHPAHIFWCLLPSALRRELDACNATLAASGVKVHRWFRAPFGLKHIFLAQELASRGMRLIAWTVRGRDGVASDPEAVARRVVARVEPGAIVLLHEGKPRSVEGILRVVDELHRLGYSFVIPTNEQLI